MNLRSVKDKFLYLLAIGFGLFLLFFFITCTWIGYEVKNQCQSAEREYDGDCVESLIVLLEDENKNFRAKNDAIWALGQLGDSRALPILQGFYTGDIPDREPLDEVVSQYELKKAINLAGGGVNISAFVWRGFFNN